MRRRVALAAFLVALVLLWQPVLRPAYKGAVILLDVYTTTLFQRNLAALVTPPPRYEEELLTLAGTTMRVSWWRPAWGGRHPAILLVNGASTAGNDMPEIRMISDAVARAGYLVMLPEFPFLKEERLEAAAVDQIDAAFAVLRAHDASRPPVGAFGCSVGGGALLAAGGRGWALRDARYLGVLGAYYDIDAYLASVVSASQRRGDAIVPWAQTADVRRRLSSAAAHALASVADRELLLAELRATTTRRSAGSSACRRRRARCSIASRRVRRGTASPRRSSGCTAPTTATSRWRRPTPPPPRRAPPRCASSCHGSSPTGIP